MIEITTDLSRMDVDRVHAWLSASYWAAGIPRDTVARAMERSLCFAAFDGDTQVGFTRVVTDATTFAYLCDVIVDEAHRGRGVGKALVAAAMAHPDLQGLRRYSLVTRDAHALYAPFGFTVVAHADRHMEIARPTLYREGTGDDGTSRRGKG